MGIGIAIIAVAALVAGVLLASQMSRPDTEGQDMSPATIDSFQMTTASEGSVVPWICGTVRTKGNLIWYGNLVTEEVTDTTPGGGGGKGGGGGGGEDVTYTTGYNYYLDQWYGICLGGGIYGNVTYDKVYENDRDATHSQKLDFEFNDGTGSSYPNPTDEDGNPNMQYLGNPPNVATMWMPYAYVGFNVSNVPTYHFVIECNSVAPLTGANNNFGVNPAARIYDLLRAAGSLSTDFNLASFQTACDYWNAKWYGLNMSCSQQKEVREWINHIFTYVDGCLRKDSDDKWYLQAFDPDEAPVATLNQEDMVDFGLTRRSWSETYNDFVANYIDSTEAFSKRTLRIQNGANQRLLGYKRQKTIDLTAYRNREVASRRLTEIMKRESYPEAQITFSANLEFEQTCQVGKIISINHDEYGITAGYFRIIQRDINEQDSNFLDFRCTQVVEKVFDTEFTELPGTEWETPVWDEADEPLAKGYFELPLNSESEGEPAYLILVARKAQEVGFAYYISTTGVDYVKEGNSTRFAQHGVLAEAYPDSDVTDTIDDDRGILYTPTREDPVFGNISRTDLFYSRRVAIIGDEMMAFQTVEYEGNNIRLKGVVRGVLNTPVSSHVVSKTIWIMNLSTSNSAPPYITKPGLYDFYIKPVPYIGSTTADIAQIGSTRIQAAFKAKTPPPPARVKVVRSGSGLNFEVTVHFSTRWQQVDERGGAGEANIANQSDTGFDTPITLGGYISDIGDNDYLMYKVNVFGTWVKKYTHIFTFTHGSSSAVDLYVKRWSTGEEVIIGVPAGDGTTYGPEI